MNKVLKQIIFAGSALNDLRAFPISARREAGFQLDRVQAGNEPDDWKPMTTVGPGGPGDTDQGCPGRLPCDLHCEIRNCDLCPALLSKEDAENQQA